MGLVNREGEEGSKVARECSEGKRSRNMKRPLGAGGWDIKENEERKRKEKKKLL
jgi:hypothetical protein